MIYLSYYYILIKGINKLSIVEKETLIQLIEQIMVKPNVKTEEDFLIAYDVTLAEESWQSFIGAINSDFYADLKLYQSSPFNSLALLIESLNKNKERDLFITTYNNDKTLFYNRLKKQVDEDLKKEVFKNLYFDKEFLRSIKIYLDADKNISKAATLANLHRNTLDNRLEKFNRVTGYDLKDYSDSVFIYLLLKDLE